MVNLLDGIKRLKERRQEAKKAVGVVSTIPDDLSELVTAYEVIGEKLAIVNDGNSIAKDQDKQELELMEKSFSFRWNNLTTDKQKELVARLLAKGLLPDTVKQALDIFKGTVVSFGDKNLPKTY